LIEEQASTIDDLLDEREIMQGQIDALLKEVARLAEGQIDALLKEVARLAAEIEIPIFWAGGE
jgi:hypothetical protein